MSTHTGIPHALLLACEPFGARLSAAGVAAAIAAGLALAARPEPDLLELPGEQSAATAIDELLGRDQLDRRLRAARALVIAVPELQEGTLAGSIPFELATRARQAGVPCYAVVRENLLDSFDERILDLQVVIEARDAAGLKRAGRRLAEIAWYE